MGGELSNGITDSQNKQNKTSRQKRQSNLQKTDSQTSNQSNQQTEPNSKSNRGSIDQKLKRKKDKIAIVAKNKVTPSFTLQRVIVIIISFLACSVKVCIIKCLSIIL